MGNQLSYGDTNLSRSSWREITQILINDDQIPGASFETPKVN